MSSHHDADAFVRRLLATPDDATARVVFADWLDETDSPANHAWAAYIRLQAEADEWLPGDCPRPRAWAVAPLVCARLTVAASLFVSHPDSLLRLLPGPNIHIRLDTLEVPAAVWELLPESVARENVVMPVALCGPTLFVAAAAPEDRSTLAKLGFILNKTVVAVRGDTDDVTGAINRHYGQTETETVDSVFYIFPIEFDIHPGAPARYGDEPDGIVQRVNAILRDARSRGGDRVVVTPAGWVRVRSRDGGTWSAIDRLHGSLVAAAAERVVRMVDDRSTFERSGRASGRFLCRLDKDRFLVHGTVKTLDGRSGVAPPGPSIQLDLAADDTLDFP